MEIQEKQLIMPTPGRTVPALFSACFLLFFLASMTWLSQRQENLAGRIAPGILRLHVIGNSNSANDQALKLKVKSYFLKLVSDRQQESKEAMARAILEDKKALEERLTGFIRENGEEYGAEISLGREYFPEKSYGDITLPCGSYDAIQVRLGKARGRNWWCVLYPRLCFLDITHGVVPEESKQLLKKTMSPEDYEQLLSSSPRPRFYFLDRFAALKEAP